MCWTELNITTQLNWHHHVKARDIRHRLALTSASATAASTSVPVLRILMALTEAEIRA